MRIRIKHTTKQQNILTVRPNRKTTVLPIKFPNRGHVIKARKLLVNNPKQYTVLKVNFRAYLIR